MNIPERFIIRRRQGYGGTSVTSRGDRREDIFHDEVDRQDFLKTLGEACQKADFEVHAYCMMRNHLRRESAESKAERIIAEEWQRLGWPQADLERRLKSDPEKLALGPRLRGETTLTLKWIAARLCLGTRNSAHVRLQTRKLAKIPGSKRNVLV